MIESNQLADIIANVFEYRGFVWTCNFLISWALGVIS